VRVIVPGDGTVARDPGRAIGGEKISLYDHARGKSDSDGNHPRQHSSAMHKSQTRLADAARGAAPAASVLPGTSKKSRAAKHDRGAGEESPLA
jgi:hypothetical protein